MKNILFILLFLQLVSARTSWYGSTGYLWTPNAFVAEDGRFGGSIDVSAKRWNFMSTFFDNKLEIAFSNYYAQKSDSGYAAQTLAVPISPSFKYKMLDEKNTYLRWGYAAGFNVAYGAYFVSTVKGEWAYIQPELSAGFALGIFPKFLNPVRMMAGGSITFADKNKKPMPFKLIGELLVAGSSEVLGEVEEQFIAGGFELTIAKYLAFQGMWRKDPSTYLKIEKANSNLQALPEQNTDGEIQLRFVYNFDAIKGANK